MTAFKEYRGLRKELYILFIGRMMTNMGSMIWPMFTLILSQKLGMSAGDIALYMLIYSAVSLPVSLLGGRLADKFNKRNIIIVCDCVSIASYVYCYFVEINFSAIVIFAAAALFQSIEYPSYEALVADFTTSADRERAYSLSYLGGNLGLVLSPSIGGFLFNSHLNLAFLISGMSIALSTVLIACFIKDVHREVDTAEASGYEKDVDDSVSGLSLVKNNRVIMIYIIACMFANAIYCMWDYLMPLDLAETYPETGSILYGTMTSTNCIVVVTCTALITAWFKKILEADKMVIGELLILGGYMLFIFGIKVPALCYIAIIIFTFGEIFNTLASSPFISRRIPASHRGRIMSVVSVATALGSALFQNVAGRIHDAKGFLSAWLFVLMLGGIEIVLLFIMKGFDKKDYSDLY